MNSRLASSSLFYRLRIT
uniref:Uncharacterized protein n=1 Tax=Anguilla anguilla TaxID=7936 RepID=A0A0E9TWY2_ANGAN